MKLCLYVIGLSVLLTVYGQTVVDWHPITLVAERIAEITEVLK